MANLFEELLPKENYSTYISSLWIIQLVNVTQIVTDVYLCVYLFKKKQQSLYTSIESVAIIECIIVLLTIYNVTKLTTFSTINLPNHALYNMGLNICQSITNTIEIGSNAILSSSLLFLSSLFLTSFFIFKVCWYFIVV